MLCKIHLQIARFRIQDRLHMGPRDVGSFTGNYFSANTMATLLDAEIGATSFTDYCLADGRYCEH